MDVTHGAELVPSPDLSGRARLAQTRHPNDASNARGGEGITLPFDERNRACEESLAFSARPF
jgi:hypothetical protein